MVGSIIDGKQHAINLRERIKVATENLISKYSITPGLAVVLVGNDPASEIYVRNKGIQTKEAGMKSLEFRLEEKTSEENLLKKVRELNEDKSVNGILVQFPVPKHMSQQKIIESILNKNYQSNTSGKVFLCGGGRKNNFLTEKIKNYHKNIFLIDSLGFDGDFTESQAFGYLAIRSLLKLPTSSPETTGCKNENTGGKIVENF